MKIFDKSNGQLGISFPFLLSIILGVLIFTALVTVSCVVTKNTRLSSQGIESLNQLADNVISARDLLKPGQYSSLTVFLDDKTAILGVNPGKTYKFIELSKETTSQGESASVTELVSIPAPNGCQTNSCICLCRNWKMTYECGGEWDCKDTGNIIYPDLKIADKELLSTAKVQYQLKGDYFLINQQGFLFFRSSEDIVFPDRDFTLYLQKGQDNEMAICQYPDKSGCYK